MGPGATGQIDRQQRRCCVDCSCTRGCGLLAVDASHLWVLIRTARKASTNLRPALSTLVEAHRCLGMRTLISSLHLIDTEVRPALADEEIAADQVVNSLDARDDAAWTGLPTHCPPGGLVFDEGDRRLLASANAACAQYGDDAWLVTDDEDFFQNVLRCIDEEQTAVWPVVSPKLLLYLFRCGALDRQQMEALLEAEQERLREDPAMQDRKRNAKQRTLDEIAAQLAVMDDD